MAITIQSNFKGRPYESLDDRTQHTYFTDALKVVQERGTDGLLVVVIKNEETDEYYLIPKVYITYWDDTISNYNLKLFLDEASGGEGGTLPIDRYTYTGKAGTTLAGINEGDIFSEVTLDEFAERLLNPDENPELEDPSLTVTLNKNIIEVGISEDIIVSVTYNRGYIRLKNQEDNLRGGAATAATIDGTAISLDTWETTIPIMNDTSQTRTFNAICTIEEGIQPLTKKGEIFDIPYPAQDLTASVNLSIVLPHFATTENITNLTKQSLMVYDSYIEVTLKNEILGDSNKQAISYPMGLNECSGIEFFNTSSNKWEWLSGSRDNSTKAFTESTEMRVINGYNKQYRKYTHNGSTIGERQLRFYI